MTEHERNSVQSYLEDEINLRELFTVLWINKVFIVIFTTFAALGSVYYALSLTNIYTAETLLTPTSISASTSLSSQYSSLASLAGFKLPNGKSGNQVDVALNLVKSKRLIDRLIQYESFLPDLMAAKSWDMETNTVSYHQAYYDNKNKKWVREVSLPFKQIPSSQEALAAFLGRVDIYQNSKTQLVTLTVDHLSPVVAQQWSFWIVKEINGILADMEIANSQAAIDFLNTQVNLTPYNELRTMFYELIRESTKSMMLASVNPEYVLTIIDPPVIPEVKSKPTRSTICIIGTLMGAILSILIILVRRYVFKNSNKINVFNWKN